MALNEKIENQCKELQLSMLNEHHHELSNRAAKEGWKYSEYLYEILKLEADNLVFLDIYYSLGTIILNFVVYIFLLLFISVVIHSFVHIINLQ